GDLFTRTRDGMDHPQARFNGDVMTVTDPEVGPTEQIGPMVHMTRTPTRIGVRDWATAGLQATVTARHEGTSGPQELPRPPLDGLLLLEAATMIATPTAGVVLADMGARVIKIEPL